MAIEIHLDGKVKSKQLLIVLDDLPFFQRRARPALRRVVSVGELETFLEYRLAEEVDLIVLLIVHKPVSHAIKVLTQCLYGLVELALPISSEHMLQPLWIIQQGGRVLKSQSNTRCVANHLGE